MTFIDFSGAGTTTAGVSMPATTAGVRGEVFAKGDVLTDGSQPDAIQHPTIKAGLDMATEYGEQAAARNGRHVHRHNGR